MPLRRIASVLTREGVPSPSGRPRWGSSTLAYILTNPVYRGDYVALRTHRVEPATRRGPTYGKSSSRARDTAEHMPLNGLVTEALITREQFDRVQERLAQNKAEGGRVVQEYLLRGRVRCEECSRHCRGKVQRLKGRMYYRYLCNNRDRYSGVTPCRHSSIRVPELERRIWDSVVAFLTDPDVFVSAAEGQQQGQTEAIERAKDQIAGLEKRLARVVGSEAKAYGGYVRGLASDETYKRVAAELKAERTWITDELERQGKVLDDARRKVEDAQAIKALYPLLLERIERANVEDKRFVLDCLDAQVTVGPSGVTLSLAVPQEDMNAVSNTPGRAGWEH